VAAGTPSRPREGDDLRDGLIPVQHQDGLSAPDVIEVAGQVVLELGNLGLLHMAMLAMLGGTVKGPICTAGHVEEEWALLRTAGVYTDADT
jgi:hypothetical protein